MPANSLAATPAKLTKTARPAGHTGFRADIEGLRALAVLPILFNHAQVKGFAGGFIGVDIFFVISGFLITGILQRDLAAGRYSIGAFYRRRILRILPALAVLLVTVMIVAVLAMTPNELTGLAKSAIATIFFVSNFYFYADTGYFAPDAMNRPLLHIWSLAVEEQFYIFWPLILAACARWKAASMAPIVAGICILSFGLSVWMVAVDMSAAFYLIPFRAWELGMGGLAALWMARPSRPRASIPLHLRSFVGVVALCALLYCIHEYREPIRFPGLNALLPCLATVALILAGPDALAGRLLSLRPLRFFGRISYSLYLWHWPVIVFGRLWFFLPQTAIVIGAEILLSVLLGWLSFRWIEGPARHRLEPLSIRGLSILSILALALIGTVAWALVLADGLPGRFAQDRVRVAAYSAEDEQAFYRRGTCFIENASDAFNPDCLARQGRGPALLLIGDSTAAHYWPGLDAVAARRYDLLQATMIGCRPLLYPKDDDRVCARFFTTLLGPWSSRHHPDAILLSGKWTKADLPILEQTLVALHARHQKVILVGPVPQYKAALPRLLFFAPRGQEAAFANRYADPGVPQIDVALRQIAARTGTPFLSPYALLCAKGICRTSTDQAVPLQFDTVHLTRQGSVDLVQQMMPAIDTALADR